MNGEAKSDFIATVTVATLGTARISCERGDDSSSSLGPGKPLALIVYLSTLPGREASRDHLVDLLWSDVEPEPARHALRQTVWFLRRRLADDAIVATRDAVRLSQTIRTDRDEFMAAIDAGRFETAVGLYSGEFLPAIALPGGIEFEHWADVERGGLKNLDR